MNVLICMRVSDLDHPTRGSVKTKCAKCNEEVWTSPATLEVITESKEDFEVNCMHCMVITEDSTMMPISQNQINEIITELNDEED